MEVMRCITRQRSDIIIILEVTFADATLCMILKFICFELTTEHFVNDFIPVVLLSFLLRLVILVNLDHAWGAANADYDQNGEDYCRPDCNKE